MFRMNDLKDNLPTSIQYDGEMFDEKKLSKNIQDIRYR